MNNEKEKSTYKNTGKVQNKDIKEQQKKCYICFTESNRTEAHEYIALREKINSSPEAEEYRRLREKINSSPEAMEYRRMREMINSSPAALEHKAMRERINSSPEAVEYRRMCEAVQRKGALKISEPANPAEIEADRMADEVMNSKQPSPLIPLAPFSRFDELKREKGGEQEDKIQAVYPSPSYHGEGRGEAGEVESRINSLSGGSI